MLQCLYFMLTHSAKTLFAVSSSLFRFSWWSGKGKRTLVVFFFFFFSLGYLSEQSLFSNGQITLTVYMCLCVKYIFFSLISIPGNIQLTKKVYSPLRNEVHICPYLWYLIVITSTTSFLFIFTFQIHLGRNSALYWSCIALTTSLKRLSNSNCSSTCIKIEV